MIVVEVMRIVENVGLVHGDTCFGSGDMPGECGSVVVAEGGEEMVASVGVLKGFV